MSNKFDDLVNKLVEGSVVERLRLSERIKSADKSDPIVSEIFELRVSDIDDLTRSCCAKTGVEFDSLSVGSAETAEEEDAGASLFRLMLSAGAAVIGSAAILGLRNLLSADLKNAPEWGLINVKKKIEGAAAGQAFAFPVEYSKDDPELKKKEDELKKLGFSVKIEKV